MSVNRVWQVHHFWTWSKVNLTETPHAQWAELRKQLFCMSELSDEEPLQGLKESYLLLSLLPPRFVSENVRAGTVFIDIFEEAHRSLARRIVLWPSFNAHADYILVFCMCQRFTQPDVLDCATLLPSRPCKNQANQAMIYCIGPEGDQARDADDFIQAGISVNFAP